MSYRRLSRLLLLGFLLTAALARPSRAETAQPAPFTTGTEVVFTEQANVLLGVGPARCLGLQNDLLVVGTERWSMGQPAVDPRLALADDPYAIHDPGARWSTSVGAAWFQLTERGPERQGFLTTRYAPIAVAFGREERLYLADPQYVYCYQRQGTQLIQRWMYQLDGIRRLYVEGPDRVFVLCNAGLARLQDQGDAPRLLHHHTAALSDLFARQNTCLVFSGQGEVDLLEFEHHGVTRSLGTVRLLNAARLARGTDDFRCLLITPKGLEHVNLRDIMPAWAGRPAFFNMGQTTLGRGDRGRLGFVKLDQPQDVVDVLPLDDRRAWLRYRNGAVFEVTLDAKARTISKPRRLEALQDIIDMAGDAQRQAVLDRAGQVHLVTPAGQLGAAIPLVEAGPWVVVDEQLYIASGPRLQRFDRNVGLGEVVFELPAGYIRDIARAGDLLMLLGDQQLVACRPGPGAWQKLGAADLGLEELPRFLSVGPGLALIGSGKNVLTSMDLSNPAQPRLLVTQSPDLPLVWGGGQGYLRDALIEADRVLVAAGEVQVFDRQALMTANPTPAAPRLVAPRHFRSFDDFVQTQRVFRLRDSLYLCSSNRNEVIRRAWLMQLGRDDAYETQYTRLGAASAQDVLMLDEQTALIAGGRAGLRVIRWPRLGEGELLGLTTEPDCVYEAVVRIGEDVYVKNGNRIRILSLRQQPRAPQTAFTFAPTSAWPRVQVDGVAVDSEEYQRQQGYQEPLKLVRQALGDDAGWPTLYVPQGEVWVDPQRGRLKFSDGRRTEPMLVGKLPLTLWGPIQANSWLQVGKYHLAPAGELSHGVIVMDLSDPDCPRQVAVSSTNPGSGYANKSLGLRGNIAYFAWNHPGPGIAALDVSDPLHPRFVSWRGVPAGTAGHMDRNWLARFEGDHMLVTTQEGLCVYDVSDPARFTLVAQHRALPPLSAWDLHRQLGVWINRPQRELQLVDTRDRDQPQVLGRIALATDLKLIKPGNFQWRGDRLWVWGLTREGKESQSALGCYDVRDPASPRLLGAQSLPGELSDFMLLDDALAAMYFRNGTLECWEITHPEAPMRLGRIPGAQTQGAYQFALHADGPPALYDNRLGAAPEQRYGQSTRFMMQRGRIVWTTGPIVDFTNPAEPRLRGGNMQAFDDEIRGMGLSPDRQRAAWYGGVDGFGWMVDLSNPRQPALKWRIERVQPREAVGLALTPDWNSDTPAVVETGRANAFVGPDPNLHHAGRPMVRFFSGSQVVLQSAPVAIKPGQKLQLSALVRTLPCLQRANSQMQLTVSHWLEARRGRNLVRLSDDANDGRNVLLESTFETGSNMEYVVLEIQASLLAWITGLKLCGPDGNNLLANSAFDQPLDENGMHPGWTLTGLPRTRERIPSPPLIGDANRRLYQGLHDSILIHDLAQPSTFAKGLLREAVLNDHDAVLGLGLVRQRDRTLVIAATEQGLTVNDMTDPREPLTRGRLPLPWSFIIKPAVGAIDENTVVITTGYTSKRQTEGIYMVDVSNPSKPRLLRYVYENSTQLSTHNRWLYKMSYRNGAQIYDLREPTNPAVICDFLFDTSNPGDAPTAILGDVLFRAHAGGGESWLAPLPDQAPRGAVVVESGAP